jgi:hypothetical protein
MLDSVLIRKADLAANRTCKDRPPTRRIVQSIILPVVLRQSQQIYLSFAGPDERSDSGIEVHTARGRDARAPALRSRIHRHEATVTSQLNRRAVASHMPPT